MPYLLEDHDGELIDFCNRYLATADLRLFGMLPPSTYAKQDGIPYPNYSAPIPPKINVCYWPSGASRFAYWFRLADDEEVNALKSVGRASNFFDFNFINEEGEETAFLRMLALPPRRISAEGVSAWIVPFVDRRYLWQTITAGDLAVDSDTTWTQLITDLADALGAEIDVEAIGEGYGSPDPDTFNRADIPAPVLLDAALHSLGLRLVETGERFGLNTYQAQTLSTGETVAESRAATHGYLIAGGDAETDADFSLPESIIVAFPKYSGGVRVEGFHEETVNAPSTVRTHTGFVRSIHTTAGADVSTDGETIDNAAEVTALAEAIAGADYAQRAKVYDVTFQLLQVLLPHSSLDDYIQWSISSRLPNGCYQVNTRYHSAPHDFTVSLQCQQLIDIGEQEAKFELIDDLIEGGASATSWLMEWDEGGEEWVRTETQVELYPDHGWTGVGWGKTGSVDVGDFVDGKFFGDPERWYATGAGSKHETGTVTGGDIAAGATGTLTISVGVSAGVREKTITVTALVDLDDEDEDIPAWWSGGNDLWNAGSIGSETLGCHLDRTEEEGDLYVTVDTMIDDGLVLVAAEGEEPCDKFAVLAGDCILVDSKGVHFDAESAAGDGLTSSGCVLSINIGCGLAFDAGALIVDPIDFVDENYGLSVASDTPCDKIRVSIGDCLEFDETGVIQIVTDGETIDCVDGKLTVIASIASLFLSVLIFDVACAGTDPTTATTTRGDGVVLNGSNATQITDEAELEAMWGTAIDTGATDVIVAFTNVSNSNGSADSSPASNTSSSVFGNTNYTGILEWEFDIDQCSLPEFAEILTDINHWIRVQLTGDGGDGVSSIEYAAEIYLGATLMYQRPITGPLGIGFPDGPTGYAWNAVETAADTQEGPAGLQVSADLVDETWTFRLAFRITCATPSPTADFLIEVDAVELNFFWGCATPEFGETILEQFGGVEFSPVGWYEEGAKVVYDIGMQNVISSLALIKYAASGGGPYVFDKTDTYGSGPLDFECNATNYARFDFVIDGGEIDSDNNRILYSFVDGSDVEDAEEIFIIDEALGDTDDPQEQIQGIVWIVNDGTLNYIAAYWEVESVPGDVVDLNGCMARIFTKKLDLPDECGDVGFPYAPISSAC